MECDSGLSWCQTLSHKTNPVTCPGVTTQSQHLYCKVYMSSLSFGLSRPRHIALIVPNHC
mgnify:CR=1 FL=1